MIDVQKSLEKWFGSMPRLENNKINSINLHIIDGCNHNCARCIKFSPLYKDLGIQNKEKLSKDFTKLAELTKNDIHSISILGGEPLLSPDIIHYMKLSRELFPNAYVTIISNGLLIPQMSEEFFSALKQYNINIAISKYYDDNVYEKAIDKLKQHDCLEHYLFVEVKEFGCSLFLQLQLDETGSSNNVDIWNKCCIKNNNILLKDGKLWSCDICCMKNALNDYFGTNFVTFEDDGIDIYNHTLEEIVEHLKKPKKACRYCTEDIYKNLYFPEKTKYDKSEWVKIK